MPRERVWTNKEVVNDMRHSMCFRIAQENTTKEESSSMASDALCVMAQTRLTQDCLAAKMPARALLQRNYDDIIIIMPKRKEEV